MIVYFAMYNFETENVLLAIIINNKQIIDNRTNRVRNELIANSTENILFTIVIKMRKYNKNYIHRTKHINITTVLSTSIYIRRSFTFLC